MKTVFAIALLAATLAGAAQSQQPPQGSCDGEPNKADCVVLFELCNANSPPGDPNYSYCVNDAAACLLHYDATLCAAINKNRATENIAHNWQFCVGTAVTKADANMCNAQFTACRQEYAKDWSAPARMVRDAAGRLSIPDRAAASDKFQRCLASTSKFEIATMGSSSLSARMK